MIWSQWYDRQNETTKAWLDNQQPKWHTWEMVVVGLCGILIGVILGKMCMYLWLIG